VFATCEDGQDLVDLGLSEGLHEVEIRARIPGTDITLASTKAEVLLTCAGSGSTTSGDGSSTGETSTGETSTRETSTGETSTGETSTTSGSDSSDSGGSPTSTTDAGTGSGDHPLDPDQEVGCSCDTSTVGDPAVPLAVLLAGLTRRRRHLTGRGALPGHSTAISRSMPTSSVRSITRMSSRSLTRAWTERWRLVEDRQNRVSLRALRRGRGEMAIDRSPSAVAP
jgi:MYXO-CTERM domain-containing protein